MAYFASKCFCVTTDGGAESHTCEVPDILLAFLAWQAGTPLLDTRHLVNHDRRLWYHALRINGWCHAWANLEKYIVKVVPAWERVERQIRCLATFWRNASWRKHAKNCVSHTDTDPRLFDHTVQSVAKWRFEYIPRVMKDLLRYREMSERYMCQDWFVNAQDKLFIKDVLAASADKELWVFMASAHKHVMGDCEEARRWGMVCNCPEHLRMRREEHVHHIPCFFSTGDV